MPSLFDEDLDDVKAASTARLPFTLSIRVTRTQVELFFHSRSMNLTFETAVLNAVKTLVCRARARVNELLLLEEVAISQPHICDAALFVGSACRDGAAAGEAGLPPSPLATDSNNNTRNNDDSISSSSSNIAGVNNDATTPAVTAKKKEKKEDIAAAKAMEWYTFSIPSTHAGAIPHTTLTRYPAGVFGCQQVFKRDFILHRRLPAAQALLAITRTLAHLTVRNRENQFVYRQQSMPHSDCTTLWLIVLAFRRLLARM